MDWLRGKEEAYATSSREGMLVNSKSRQQSLDQLEYSRVRVGDGAQNGIVTWFQVQFEPARAFGGQGGHSTKFLERRPP